MILFPRLLDENLLSGFKSEFSLNESDVRVDLPEMSGDKDNENNEDNEEIETNKDIENNDAEAGTSQESTQSTKNNITENGQHNESKDMFENSEDDDNEHIAQGGHEDGISEANRKAREAVLQSSSSDSDRPVNNLSNSQELSPRKKLKTKKELDELRRKSQGDNDPSEEDESDNESNDSSSEVKSPRIHLKRAEAKSPSKEKDIKSWKKLNLIAQSIDAKNNLQLQRKLKVDLKFLDKDVVDELGDDEKVTLKNSICSLAASNEALGTLNIIE